MFENMSFNDKTILAYRLSLGVLFLSLLCPFVKVNASSNVRAGDAQRDVNQAAARSGVSLGNQPKLTNQSASANVSVSGISTLWGKAVLLLLIAGAAVSFIGLEKLIPPEKKFMDNQEKAIMAGVGALSLLMLLIVMFSAGSYVNADANVSTQYADSSMSAGTSWGWYLAFLASLAIGASGFLANWTEEEHPISQNEEASSQPPEIENDS